MKRIEQCQKCGQDYKADGKEAPEEVAKCNTCGAEIVPSEAHKEHEVQGPNDDEHLIEKGLRKVTDGIAANKTKH
ncbi:hypothetical protein [Vreelandella sulfidaeris]|uniref:hypothetical protein n=1 Tax=Vreelandella sulfidaeris TaxID=115553 RepID=UPI0035F05720|tara:strand:- start:232 stop:456 length:225 start_codon:yes stop_codon:yes gene_type:complete